MPIKTQRRKTMKDLDALLKAVADGLNAMAEGIHAIAKKVGELAKDQAPKKVARTKTAIKKKTAAPVGTTKKKAKPQVTKPMPATDQVLAVIKGSGDGVDNAKISKETGLNQQQVSSALLRLKKYGKVKSIKRGVHTAV
jgi:predicted Rossmann fold nucleotide-binding protein DprA/Smf involved in DNA uptake